MDLLSESDRMPLIALHPTAVSADCAERSREFLRSDAVQESDREGDDAEQAEGSQRQEGKVAARATHIGSE